MGKSNVVELQGRVGSTDPLTELLHTRARQLLQQAIEVEVQAVYVPLLKRGYLPLSCFQVPATPIW